MYNQQLFYGTQSFETTNGSLPCKCIVYRPWIYSTNSSQDLKQSIDKFVESVITYAISHNYTTIGNIIYNILHIIKYSILAFPSIGCGQLGYDPKLIAEYMIGETYRQLKTLLASQLDVSFVLLPEQQNVFQAFVDQLNIVQSINDTPLTIAFNKQSIQMKIRMILIV